MSAARWTLLCLSNTFAARLGGIVATAGSTPSYWAPTKPQGVETHYAPPVRHCTCQLSFVVKGLLTKMQRRTENRNGPETRITLVSIETLSWPPWIISVTSSIEVMKRALWPSWWGVRMVSARHSWRSLVCSSLARLRRNPMWGSKICREQTSDLMLSVKNIICPKNVGPQTKTHGKLTTFYLTIMEKKVQ